MTCVSASAVELSILCVAATIGIAYLFMAYTSSASYTDDVLLGDTVTLYGIKAFENTIMSTAQRTELCNKLAKTGVPAVLRAVQESEQHRRLRSVVDVVTWKRVKRTERLQLSRDVCEV